MDKELDTIALDEFTTNSPYEASNAVQLDPEGDVTLAINGSVHTQDRFLVSSRVLSLASPVFSKMFGPNLIEGAKVRSKDQPCIINLEEDDARAMEIILRILHYQSDGVSPSIEPKPLATIAIHSDKYDCNRALRPWIEQWCNNSRGVSAPEDFGFMLLATYIFRSSSFSDIAAMAVKQLKPDFVSVWNEHETLSLLPETITGTLSDNISKTLGRLHHELQSTEGMLQVRNTGYTMPGRFCLSCGRTLPDEAKRCHPCNNMDLCDRYCTKDNRVGEYFSILRRCELWPSEQPFKSCAPWDIGDRFQYAQTDHKHQCRAKEDCPLRRELEDLSARVRRILGDIKGLSIGDIFKPGM